MKRLVNACLLLIFSPVFLLSCKKDSGFTAPGSDSTNVIVKAATCRISSEKSDQTIQNGSQYALAYDASGNLITVTSTNPGSADAITVTSITAKQINTVMGGYNLRTYDFDNDIITGPPTSYTLSRPAQASLDRLVFLNYDAQGRVSHVEAQRASTKAYLQSLDVTYDDAGNAASLTYFSGTGTSKVQAVYTATQFDDKHNPFDSLKAGSLMMYNWDFFSGSNMLTVIQHLSRHNPLTWGITDGTYYTNATMTYQYNSQNYPTEVKEVTVGSYADGPSTNTIVWDYTYDCK